MSRSKASGGGRSNNSKERYDDEEDEIDKFVQAAREGNLKTVKQ